MKRVLIAGVAATFVGGAAPAVAADWPMNPPALFSWSGFYIGGHLGGAWGAVDWANVSLTGEPASFRSRSFAGGIHLGSNFETSAFVLGLEGSFTGMRLNDRATSVVNPVVTYTSRIDWVATVVGRLGYSTGPGLIYLTAGYAAGRIVTAGNNPGFPDSFELSGVRSGWTLGGGYEHMFMNNWILGIDYKYIDLTPDTVSGTSVAGLAYTITRVDAQIHKVMARLSWKFGGW